jgi:hypothetical protein
MRITISSKIGMLLLAAGCGLTAASSRGDTFAFSYTFQSGVDVTGTFDGDPIGNLIFNISDTSLSVGSYVLPGAVYDESFNGAQYVDGGALMSFDGAINNFFFINSDYANGDNSFTGYFGSIVSVPLGGNFAQAGAPSISGNVVDQPINSSWSVKDTTETVPDGGSTATMLGVAALGLLLFGRRLVARKLHPLIPQGSAF